MSTTIDYNTIEQAIEDRARELGHDLRLTGFTPEGEAVWKCWNGCGVEDVQLHRHSNGWTLYNRPVGRCVYTGGVIVNGPTGMHRVGSTPNGCVYEID